MPDVVVDIGNSRVKFCRCDALGLRLPVRGLSTEDLAACDRLANDWELASGVEWAVASSNPDRRDQFTNWAATRGDRVAVIKSWRDVPIRVNVDEPDRVGIDRLLNVFAAAARVKPGQPAIIVDAGSAVTVNLLDESGAFAGGAIFPGLRLMALALHEHTAQLPLVATDGPLPDGPPGKNTEAAIRLGILHAVAGGIDALIRATSTRCSIAPRLFLTGGDMSPQLAGLLETRQMFPSEIRPALTLEGIHRAATQTT
jgi:type III pantothenate kinase